MDLVDAKFPDFETLPLKIQHLEEIQNLLNDNYVENTECEIKTIFSTDFLYWYFKYIPQNFILGLIYKNKLVGVITAIFLDMSITDIKLKVPYINLLCIHSQLRNLGLGQFLINKMKDSLSKIKLPYALFAQTIHENKKALSMGMDKPFSKFNSRIIPINYTKLKRINFISSDQTNSDYLEKTSQTDNFHLTTESDLEQIIPKINKFNQSGDLSFVFTPESAKHFILPKKHIVYSFFKKPSEFICIYVSTWLCTSHDEVLTIGNLAYYYTETMNLTSMIRHILPKLIHYEIDLFNTYAIGPEDVNLTKYETGTTVELSTFNLKIPQIDCKKILFYPF